VLRILYKLTRQRLVQPLSHGLIAFLRYEPGASVARVARALPVRLFIVGLYVHASRSAFEGIELSNQRAWQSPRAKSFSHG